MSLPHNDPLEKERNKNSHVSTWTSPEREELIRSAVAKGRKPRK